MDDESTPLIVRRLVLEKAGYRVVTAVNAKLALDILKQTDVSLVISDHLMPEMTGAELAAQVKRLFPTVPFVLLSGVNDFPPGAEAADVFLSKLEGPEAMLKNIRTLLKQ